MNKILIVSFSLLIAFAFASKDDDIDWIEYKNKFHKNKIFDNEQNAFKNFKEHQKKINEHNSNENRTYDQELNEFSIYSEEEFVQIYCGTRAPDDELDPIVGAIVNAGRKATKTTTTKAPTTTTTSGTTTQAPMPNWPGPLGNYTRDTLPLFVNYTNQCQPIQNQAGCGSCWAFAAGSGIGLQFKF